MLRSKGTDWFHVYVKRTEFTKFASHWFHLSHVTVWNIIKQQKNKQTRDVSLILIFVLGRNGRIGVVKRLTSENRKRVLPDVKRLGGKKKKSVRCTTDHRMCGTLERRNICTTVHDARCNAAASEHISDSYVLVNRARLANTYSFSCKRRWKWGTRISVVNCIDIRSGSARERYADK